MANPPQPPSPGPTQGIDSGLRWSLRTLAASCIVVAGLHLGEKVKVDPPVLYLIGIAFGALAFPEIGKLSFGKDGLNIERYQELKSSLEQVKAGTSELATAVENRIGGPSPASAESTAGLADVAPCDLAALDPQKGRWGGSAEANGRRITAHVAPSVLRDDWFTIDLRVTSTDRRRPLTGTVRFHLHPTFQTPQVRPVANGEATLHLVAWGAFTVGAETSDGTKLELDLAELPDAPALFKAR